MSRLSVRGLDPAGGSDGQVPVISGGKFVIGDAPGAGDGRLLSPNATITVAKSSSNPTLNEVGALPENIVKVGTTYWLVYCRPTSNYTVVDVRLASSSSPAGPWTPYGSNPILTLGSQAWETVNGANGAWIVEDGDTFHLYYASEPSSGKTAGIGVATATAITGPYTKYASNPIVSPGATGAWDSLRVQEPTVVKVDTTWVMGFMAEDTDYPKNQSEQVGFATATSPLGPWTKLNPTTPGIPFGPSGAFDSTCVADPSLLYEDGVYYCTYSTVDPATSDYWSVGLATATDPAGPWTRHGNTAILTPGPAGSFDAHGAFRGAIFRDGDTYYHPYGGVPTKSDTLNAKGGTAVLNITGGKSTSAALVTADGTLPDASANVDKLAVLTGHAMLGSDGVHPNDYGMTYLADQYEAALSAAGKTPASGALMTAYGDSWTGTDTMNTPGMRAIHQLRDRLSLTLTNHAVGGYKMGDAAVQAVGTAGPFVAGTGGLVAIPNLGLNDLAETDTAQQRQVIENYMRALFAVLNAAERIENESFAFSGSDWVLNSGSTDKSGGSNRQTTIEGATATITITTPGTYYLLTNGLDGSTAHRGGELTISQAGTTLATIDIDGQALPTGTLLASFYGPLAVRLDNVVAGTLTVTASNMGRSGAANFLDALVRISPTPPTILAVKPVRILTVDKPDFLEFIRGLYDTMAAEFGPNVVVCDPAPGWQPDAATAPPELWFSDGTGWSRPTADPATATRYVRTVNGTAPDATGNVTVAAGSTTGALRLWTSVGASGGDLMWDDNGNLMYIEET